MRFFRKPKTDEFEVVVDPTLAKRLLAAGYEETDRETWLPVYRARQAELEKTALAAREAEFAELDKEQEKLEAFRAKRNAVLKRIGVKDDELELFR